MIAWWDAAQDTNNRYCFINESLIRSACSGGQLCRLKYVPSSWKQKIICTVVCQWLSATGSGFVLWYDVCYQSP